MSAVIQLGSLNKLAKEEQWTLWLEDLTDVLYLNGLGQYYLDVAEQPRGPGSEKDQLEFNRKHETVRAIIHSALSTDVREKMKHRGYDKTKHRGKVIVDYAEKSVKLIGGNMDKLYNSMWKDLRRTDFKSWVDFVAEFRRLYGKLKETGQEVTQKSACIHLFDKVRGYLPIWSEINESRYFADPDVEKLLLELETRGRQLEYEGVTLATLRSAGDKYPKASVSSSKSEGADSEENKISLKEGWPQGQSQVHVHYDRNKEGTSQRENRLCNICTKAHPGDCWPVCGDCEKRHSPRYVCRKSQSSWRQNKSQYELQGEVPGPKYLPGSGRPTDRLAKEPTQATENVFEYNMNTVCIESAMINKGNNTDQTSTLERKMEERSGAIGKTNGKTYRTLGSSEQKPEDTTKELDPGMPATSQSLDDDGEERQLTLKAGRTFSDEQSLHCDTGENKPETKRNVLAKDGMYLEYLPEKLNSETQENISNNIVTPEGEKKPIARLFKDTEAQIPEAATIAEKIKEVLRDIGVPELKVAMVTTKIQEIYRDITLPVVLDQSKYKINQSTYGIGFGSSIGAVGSPFRKSRSISRDVSNDWIKDRKDRNGEKTYQ